MIAFACTSCQKKLKVKDDLAGKKVKCPGCGNPVAVPQSAAATLSGPVQPSLANPDPARTLPPGVPADAGQCPPPPHNRVQSVKESRSDADGWTSLSAGPEGKTTRSWRPRGADPELYDFLAPAQQPDEIGRLGPFRVLRVLGAGGMGVVYQAEDPQLKRPVALKAMRPALAASASARQRFLREAQAAAIVHDHVVPIHQVGEDRGVPFLAMQLLEGESLDERLQRGPRLSLGETLRIGRETAEGLAAAHQRGLIHRDIKPANLWLERHVHGRQGGDFRVKILDFGLARGAGDQAQLTQQGAILGTPSYMAPEQATGEAVDARCDLFSLGCVLYRLVTGQLPFRGSDTIAMLLAVATENPRPPGKVNPATPAELSDLVMRLLAKKPGDRPASAQDVVEALAAIERKHPDFTAAPTHADIRPVRRTPPRTSRRPVLLALAGVLLAAGLAAGIYALTRPAGQGPSRLPKPGGDAGTPRPAWSLAFDGKSSYVTIPSFHYKGDHPLTLEAWTVLDRPITDAKLEVLLGDPEKAGICINSGPGHWQFFGWFGGYVHALERRPVARKRLVHLAGVFDGQWEIRFYVDGQLQSRTPINRKYKPSPMPFTLGANPDPGGRYTDHFLGRIAGVRISRVARYDNDFTPARRFEPDADTLALYHFDEGRGDVLRDSSGNGHHGRIVGAGWVSSDWGPEQEGRVREPNG
jgi:serine/threonine protein kinase